MPCGAGIAGLDTWTILPAEPRDALAPGIDDRQARAEIGHLAVDLRVRDRELADDEIRMLAAAAVQRAGAMQIVPLRLVSSVAVEHLDTVVRRSAT